LRVKLEQGIRHEDKEWERGERKEMRERERERERETREKSSVPNIEL